MREISLHIAEALKALNNAVLLTRQVTLAARRGKKFFLGREQILSGEAGKEPSIPLIRKYEISLQFQQNHLFSLKKADCYY